VTVSAPITVGVLAPISGGFYYGGVLSGITREVAAVGGRVVFFQTTDAGGADATDGGAPDFTTPTAWNRVDGIVSVAAAAGVDYLRRLKDAGIPVVLTSNVIPGFDAPTAMPDNAGGARAAVEHLIEHGHTRIGFAGNLVQSDMRERYESYQETLIAHGLEPDPSYIFVANNNVEIGGREVANTLMARGMPVTALFAVTDRNAIGLIETLTAAGYTLPEDLAIVGFDDVERGWFITPALSTINQHFDEMGALSARLLLDEIAGKHLGEVRVDTPSTFVPRDSCGCNGGQPVSHAVSRPVHLDLAAADAMRKARERLLAAGAIRGLGALPAHRQESLLNGMGMLADAVDEAVLGGHQIRVEHIRKGEIEIRRHQPVPELVQDVMAAITTYILDLDESSAADQGETRRILAGCVARIASEFSQIQAGAASQRTVDIEGTLREQYDLSVELLERDGADAKELKWLRHTHVRTACLGLWEGAPADRLLKIVGVYDETSALTGLRGTEIPVRNFPPAEIVRAADPAEQEACFVIPVKGRGVDWGVLSVIGTIDTRSASGQETYDHWASLLTIALEQERLNEDLYRSEERYSLASNATNDGLWDWDVTTGLTYYSERCRHLLGLRAGGDLPNGPDAWMSSVHPDDKPALKDAIQTGISRARPFEVEARVRGAIGGYRWMLYRAQPVPGPDASDAAIRVVGSVTDIHARKELEDRLRLGALYDEVTGLPNRRMFVDRLTWTIAQVHRSGKGSYAVVFLDLDGFKLVNDSLGHLVGDELLVKVAERLRRGLRTVDTAARFGGDEFAVLLYDIEPDAVLATVERIQEEIARPVRLHGTELAITASVGVATSSTGYRNAEDVLRDADTAMYHAKSVAPGSTSMFDEQMHAKAMNHLQVQNELRQALERNEFEIYYQPIVNLASRTTRQFEALIRWQHPVRGLVLPGEFLPAMDETGSILVLGHWILDDVCRQIAAWHAAGITDVNVSVNLSNREFWSNALLSFVDTCLKRHQLSPDCITLEITESVIMTNPAAALHTMEELRDRGIRLHIDDFGTGNSSLHALRSFPLDALKIDRSFIQELGIDQRTTDLVELIVAMGRTLGMGVVAEGVETEAQARFLQDIGCAEAQGFWFAKAVPAIEALGMLEHPFARGVEAAESQQHWGAARR